VCSRHYYPASRCCRPFDAKLHSGLGSCSNSAAALRWHRMFGMININKPPGVTSRRMVDLVERLVRPAKAGHAGTLDPLATGVLVVCVGAATRLIEYVQRMPKRYRAKFLLGRSSPTEDVDGDVTLLNNPTEPSLAALTAAAQALTGPILQRPPNYSALKVAG